MKRNCNCETKCNCNNTVAYRNLKQRYSLAVWLEQTNNVIPKFQNNSNLVCFLVQILMLGWKFSLSFALLWLGLHQWKGTVRVIRVFCSGWSNLDTNGTKLLESWYLEKALLAAKWLNLEQCHRDENGNQALKKIYIRSQYRVFHEWLSKNLNY